MTYALTDRDIEHGFWYHRREEGFPPMGIRDPEEYDGSPRANVVCTQTNLPASYCQFLCFEVSLGGALQKAVDEDSSFE